MGPPKEKKLVDYRLVKAAVDAELTKKKRHLSHKILINIFLSAENA
jgi:hypothetical protein